MQRPAKQDCISNPIVDPLDENEEVDEEDDENHDVELVEMTQINTYTFFLNNLLVICYMLYCLLLVLE